MPIVLEGRLRGMKEVRAGDVKAEGINRKALEAMRPERAMPYMIVTGCELVAKREIQGFDRNSTLEISSEGNQRIEEGRGVIDGSDDDDGESAGWKTCSHSCDSFSSKQSKNFYGDAETRLESDQ